MRQVFQCFSVFVLIAGFWSVQGCKDGSEGTVVGPPVALGDTSGSTDKPKTPDQNPDSGKTDGPTVTIVELDSAETWEPLFIRNKADIPLNEFKAFYFEDSTASIMAYSERVPFPALSYSGSGPHGIPARRLNAYWIGKFDFPEKAIWKIDVSLSNSSARILVDKREIHSGRVNRSLNHAFAKGEHTIEIEYRNDWESIAFNVRFAPVGEDLPPEPIDTAVTGVEYWYAGAYETGSADSSVQVVLKKSVRPVVLFLSSYDALRWNIQPADSGQVLAVFVDSYEPQSTVTGLGASVPVTQLKGIPFSYKLLPECHAQVGLCDDPGFAKLTAYMKNESKVLTGFTGAYNPASLILPEVILDAAKYKQIEEQTQALIDGSRLRVLVDVFPGDTAATWQSHFLAPGAEIPVGKFQAFYFSDKSPDSVLHSELAAAPDIKYSWSAFHGLDAHDFAGYWVGKFEFAEPTVLHFGIKQSHAQTAIYVDKRPILAGPEDREGTYTVQAGTHLIEIQHINNWHTIEYSVSLEPR